jgi:hypothetical protein
MVSRLRTILGVEIGSWLSLINSIATANLFTFNDPPTQTNFTRYRIAVMP